MERGEPGHSFGGQGGGRTFARARGTGWERSPGRSTCGDRVAWGCCHPTQRACGQGTVLLTGCSGGGPSRALPARMLEGKGLWVGLGPTYLGGEDGQEHPQPLNRESGS